MTSLEPIYVDDRTAAKMLGLSHEMFRRTWARLVAEDGLPPPWYPPRARARGSERSRIRHWDVHALRVWSQRRLAPELREHPVEHADRARLDARLDRIERGQR
jgi:hypothetical protein